MNANEIIFYPVYDEQGELVPDLVSDFPGSSGKLFRVYKNSTGELILDEIITNLTGNREERQG